MKLARWLSLTTLTVFGLGLHWVANCPATLASGVSSSEVDQNRYVLLANTGGSRLTILEQISNTRPCWQENGNEVQALLLNFDFTDICGRYTDLNGYSVRAAGQDLGLRYRLQVETQGNAMVLYAVPRQGGSALEIGRTRRIPSQFGRIYLNPGWRITHRMYNGQKVGHVYLTSDQSESTLIANASNRSPGGSTVVTQPGSSNSTVPVRDRPSPGSGSTVVDSSNSDSPRRSRGNRNRLTNLPRIDIHFSINWGSQSGHQNEIDFRETSEADPRLGNY